MDKYMTILQSILSTDEKFLYNYLDGLHEHAGFGVQNNDESVLVQHINSLLTTSTNRTLGLYLLDKFIDSCSFDMLEKKGNLWTTFVLKACNNQELLCDNPIMFHVLNKLINISQHVPDLAKSFISTHISKIYNCLINIPSSKSKYSLHCIETCLRVYPGSSGSSRNSIERYLWNHIDLTDFEVVQNYGKCLHILQQVKGGGVQGISNKQQWKKYQLQLIGSIHSVYNKMFAACVELYEEKIYEEKLPWDADQNEFDPEPVKKAAQLYTRCRNLITYLSIALGEPFPVEKPILIKKILNIVIRGLSVNCLILERNPIADNIALSILLPKLHIDLLNLLNVTITILRGHLRPYSDLILSVLVDELRWTSAKNVHGKNWTLRKKVFDTVTLWCKIFNSGSRCETVAEYLFQEILTDITPTQNEFTLKVLGGARKHMSKKARRQLHNAQNEKSNITNTHSINTNRKQNFSEIRKQNLCIAGLRCFQQVILAAANFLKPTILKMMQTCVAQIAGTFYETTQNPDNFYSNENCRIEIYNALYGILITTHHCCPPPAELVLAIFQTAYARDKSIKVQIHCSFIIQNLEKIIHPQKESLLYAIDARDLRNTFIKMGSENLLREFDINFSNSQPLNSSVTNYDKYKLEHVYKTQTDISSISGKNKEIESKRICTEDFGVIESLKHHVDNVVIMKAKNQSADDGKILSIEIPENLPIPPELVVSDDDDVDNVISREEDGGINIWNIDEPVKKKQKVGNEHDENYVTANNSNIENNTEYADNILAEIASQFIDELE